MAEAVKAPEVIKTFATARSPVAYLDAPEFSRAVVLTTAARLIAAVRDQQGGWVSAYVAVVARASSFGIATSDRNRAYSIHGSDDLNGLPCDHSVTRACTVRRSAHRRSAWRCIGTPVGLGEGPSTRRSNR